jgi:hypothetical protein
MAVQGDPPTADRINQTAPICKLKFAAPGSAHLEWFWARRHLGGGVPKVWMPTHQLLNRRQVPLIPMFDRS